MICRFAELLKRLSRPGYDLTIDLQLDQNKCESYQNGGQVTGDTIWSGDLKVAITLPSVQTHFHWLEQIGPLLTEDHVWVDCLGAGLVCGHLDQFAQLIVRVEPAFLELLIGMNHHTHYGLKIVPYSATESAKLVFALHVSAITTAINVQMQALAREVVV